MNFETDWRNMGQMDYLYQKKLLEVSYEPYSKKWEHEHCAFCWDKISLLPNTVQSAYCTTDKRHWICPKCYSDFKDTFKWIVKK